MELTLNLDKIQSDNVSKYAKTILDKKKIIEYYQEGLINKADLVPDQIKAIDKFTTERLQKVFSTSCLARRQNWCASNQRFLSM